MKLKMKYYWIFSLLFCSCSSWIDIKPSDRLSEDMLFNTSFNITCQCRNVLSLVAVDIIEFGVVAWKYVFSCTIEILTADLHTQNIHN